MIGTKKKHASPEPSGCGAYRYPFPLPQLGPGFVLEPQAQLLWQRTSFGEADDGLGPVALGSTSGTTGRVGLKGKWTVIGENGLVWQPYLRANYWNEWGGNASTVYTGLGVTNSIPVVSHAQYMDMDAGLSTLINDRLSAFAEIGYQFSVSNDGGGKRDGVKGSLGLRYQF